MALHGAHGCRVCCADYCTSIHHGPQTIWSSVSCKSVDSKETRRYATEIALGLQVALRFGRMKDEGIASVEGTSLIKRNVGKHLILPVWHVT